MPDMERLTRAEWRTLRALRLSALLDSPDLFLSTYEKELTFGRQQWLAEFDRGAWLACRMDGSPISLLGITREAEGPPLECYIEYLWVAPAYRRSGIASGMLTTVISQLRTDGMRTALLWILDGNDAAMRLYEKVGFVRTSLSQPIGTRPGRSEELLKFTLG